MMREWATRVCGTDSRGGRRIEGRDRRNSTGGHAGRWAVEPDGGPATRDGGVVTRDGGVGAATVGKDSREGRLAARIGRMGDLTPGMETHRDGGTVTREGRYQTGGRNLRDGVSIARAAGWPGGQAGWRGGCESVTRAAGRSGGMRDGEWEAREGNASGEMATRVDGDGDRHNG